MNNITKERWSSLYLSSIAKELGFYIQNLKPSLHLLSDCHVSKDAAILEVGVGTAVAIDYLIDNGHTNVTVIDISDTILGMLRDHLRREKSILINWIVDNPAKPNTINQLKDIALWHDTTVLHFLVEKSSQDAYFSTIQQVIREDGYVILAACSTRGLTGFGFSDVTAYDYGMISERLGDDFELIQAFDYLSYMPSGHIEPFVYTLFQRKHLKQRKSYC